VIHLIKGIQGLTKAQREMKGTIKVGGDAGGKVENMIPKGKVSEGGKGLVGKRTLDEGKRIVVKKKKAKYFVLKVGKRKTLNGRGGEDGGGTSQTLKGKGKVQTKQKRGLLPVHVVRGKRPGAKLTMKKRGHWGGLLGMYTGIVGRGWLSPLRKKQGKKMKQQEKRKKGYEI